MKVRGLARSLGCVACVLFTLAPLVGSADDPYDIAVIAPLTGATAFLGKSEAKALEVLQNVVNKSGGIRGRQIHFTVQDDQSIAQNTVALLNGDIARKVPVIIGAATASTCGAMLPLLSGGPVAYCFSPGIHPPPASYMFSAGVSTADYITASLRYMRGRGWRTFALMTSNDATGQDAERSVETALALPENRGKIGIVDREHFNTADLTVAAQIAKVKASGAQAVIFGPSARRSERSYAKRRAAA